MTETGSIDRPSVAKHVSRLRSRKPAVSASALALHLDCSRTYIGKLEAEGVIQRQGDGFPLDRSRVAYLRYLRRKHRRSPRAEADADHVKVKTEMLQLRLMEKKQPIFLARPQSADGGLAFHRILRSDAPVLPIQIGRHGRDSAASALRPPRAGCCVEAAARD
jgi:hypothetical protein